MMHRRTFIKSLFAAPAVITTPGLLMPVKSSSTGYWHSFYAGKINTANGLLEWTYHCQEMPPDPLAQAIYDLARTPIKPSVGRIFNSGQGWISKEVKNALEIEPDVAPIATGWYGE